MSLIKQKYPIFGTNQAVEFLVAKDSGTYLEEINLTMQDLKDIETSRQQIRDGFSTKCDSSSKALKVYLK